MTLGAMLLTLSIILPQIFHLTGIPQVGAVFLPMHIPVLLTGFLLGPVYGAVIGVIAPVVSSLITNMPALARLPFMVGELAVYGLASGLFYHTFKLRTKKFGIIVSLTAAMLLGRIFYALMLLAASKLLHIECGGVAAAVSATVTGVYGIVLQLITIPPIVYAIGRKNK